MSTYRVTMKVSFIVDIHDENAQADPRPSLQGDTKEAALNRASWVWLKGMQAVNKLSKSLGVKRTFAMKEGWEVIRVQTDTVVDDDA